MLFSYPMNDDLYFTDNFQNIKLYHKTQGFLGKFYVWHDTENREYIEYSNTILYLDLLTQA